MEALGYSPRKLAKLLDVSPNHIYGLVKQGELKAIRLGRRVLIPRYELERLGVFPDKEGRSPAMYGGAKH